MFWKKLLGLSKDESLENLRRNQLVFRVAKEAILNFVSEGEVDPKNEFDNSVFMWNRQEKSYFLIAEDGEGRIVVAFKDALSATIVRDGINDFKVDPVFDNTMSLLRQCIILIDGKTHDVEKAIAKSYLKEVRFGDKDYLEAEFKNFAKAFLENLTENTGKELYDHLPFKFNYKGRLKEYLAENGGNTANLHITN